MKLYNLASAGFFIAKNPGGKMALSLLAANNAQTVLAAGISSTATSLTVNAGTGTLFPSPVAGTSFFKLTIIDAATGSLTEIVHVTARAGDVFTIQRGQEGTVARAWSANDIAANMMTAGTLSYILGNFQPLDPTLTALAALVGVANKLPYFNGDDTAALTDLTPVGRDIIGKSSIADILTYLGLDHFGYEPSTGETAIFNGNKNLRYFINNNNESGVASVDFGLLWGFDGGGKLTKGIIPVARLDGLSGSTGNSTTAVMSQKAVTDALPTVTQSTGASTTSVMSQKATTDAINAVKTTVVQSVGTSTTSVMSQNAVTSLVNDAASVGVNQLWNDVTSSRTVGINYTNTTGRPIMIAMNVKNVPAGLFASSITVQGIELSAGSTVSGEHRFISAIVPPGQVYRYQPLASSNFILLELR
ncbi:hypothetical protein [Citrobacter cronae]|uniref:hypothetical protein n=1 Tax=Citrobacter cronae TaxID=1748967 RepID=UPI00351CFE2B